MRLVELKKLSLRGNPENIDFEIWVPFDSPCSVEKNGVSHKASFAIFQEKLAVNYKI